MIGMELYTLTSFEIIVGGITMFVLGVLATVALIVYACFRISGKIDEKTDPVIKDDEDEDEYIVEDEELY